MTPNRIATYLNAIAGLAAALAPAVADLDWTSTAGVIAGAAAVTAAVQGWLVGWRKHEARVEGVEIDVPPVDDPSGVPADRDESVTPPELRG